MESPQTRCLRTAIFAALLLVLGTACPAAAPEYRAFWVDAWNAGLLSQSQVDTLLGVPGNANSKGVIREANCNMVIVQVRRRADVCYPSGVGEPYMSGLSPANFNSLAAMIKAAHDTTGGKKRVEVHCWSVVFKTAKGQVYSQHSDPPTGSLTTFDNYWPTRLSSTTGAENSDGAFDPGHPKCLEYLINAHMDLVNFQTTAGPGGADGRIDGIHYDYIRFEAATEGFNPTSVARYNARYGLSGNPSAASEQFKQWRRDQVTAFARQMYARIQKTSPQIRQSGSFVTWNPSPASSTRAAFQATRPYYDVYSDWDSWQQEGIMDMAVPMTYYNWASLPSDYTKWMNFEKDRKFNRHMIIGPGIYLNSLANAIYELQMTRDASPAGNYAHGFSGYSYRTPYSGGTWAGFAPSLVSSVTPTWADIPEMPWKTSPTKAHIMGTVTIHGSGAWADGARVSLSGPVSRVQTNDGTGFYAFIDLPVGTYTVTASLAGHPTATGSTTIAVGQVTGNMYELDLVLGGNVPPTITTQPISQSVKQGTNATFTVGVSGTAPFAYQWRLNGADISGATASSYTRANVQPADAGTYSVVVTNAYGMATSSGALLTVVVPPTITTQPLSQTVTQGQNATFTVAASGTAPFTYQWRFNGAPIGGATASSYTRSNVQLSDAGDYSVVVANSAGSDTSAKAVLTVVVPPVPPAITTQPQGQTVVLGETAAFNVVATGGIPLSYQWRFNGADIAGATDSSYARAQVGAADAGDYSVRVTNPYGSLLSDSATLVVDTNVTLPVIVTQPQSQTVIAGQSATFSVLATNKAPLSYQWRLNGAPIAGATGSSYTRSNVQTGDAGNYSVVITNIIGAVGSADAELTVHFALTTTASAGGSVSKDPAAASYAPNTVVTLTATPANTNFVFTGWGGDASGTDNPLEVTLTTNKSISATFVSLLAEIVIDNADAGWSNTSPSGTWTVGSNPSVPMVNSNYLYTAGTGGSEATRSCRWTPELPVGGYYDVYVYYQIGANRTVGAPYTVHYYGGSVTSVQNQYSSTPNQGGWFLVGTNLPFLGGTAGYVELKNNTPDTLLVSADAAKFVLVAPFLAPVITQQPQPAEQSVTVGQGASFTVEATGTAPLSYQWRHNGVPLAGATASSYTRNNVEISDAGNYSVVITNVAGSVTSLDAVLVVNVPPTITTQPQSQAVIQGGNASFTVAAAGTAPLVYQWYFDGQPLADATDSALTITNAQPADAGSYAVEVLNLAGQIMSDPATLTVNAPPQIDEIRVLADGRFELQISGAPGQYVVEATPDVAGVVSWTALTNFTVTTTNFQYYDSETGLARRFYRVRWTP